MDANHICMYKYACINMLPPSEVELLAILNDYVYYLELFLLTFYFKNT